MRRSQSSRRLRRRRGFTLLELMISVVLTLMLMMALVEVFALLGENVRRTRGLMEMSTQLRVSLSQLQQDLNRITVDGSAWSTGRANLGYLEIIEGPGRDGDPDGDGNFFQASGDILPSIVNSDAGASLEAQSPLVPTGSVYGDLDDVLMFTAVSAGEPFRGKIQARLIDPTRPVDELRVIESDKAEIVYWVRKTSNGVIALHRRVVLILPELNKRLFVTGNTAHPFDAVPFATWAERKAFYQRNDLSVRLQDDKSGIIANNLSDLSRRENRFAHHHNPTNNPAQDNYPYLVFLDLFPRVASVRAPGSELLLPDLLAFDVKVYDPQAPVTVMGTGGSTISLKPGDPGFYVQMASILSTAEVQGAGAFVDLGYDGVFNSNTSTWEHPTWRGSHFSGPPQARLSVVAARLNRVVLDGSNNKLSNLGYRTFSTWPLSYEHDGVNQDRDTVLNGNAELVDEGRDGIDNNADGQVDELAELETSPPYPYNLRGIEVQIRIHDPSTRQMRQASHVQSLMGI